ncbi:hypothetical protein EVAR_74266_1 [Eumeta japonica]|uniref:Uncharacterized protein n=1 Tax=Eumeta variegata TaxID=151549 RepID=A0A4C1SFL4_EUMVA|nr:hypothetical protein EVAR_74266_1 [Eumeta japonica]
MHAHKLTHPVNRGSNAASAGSQYLEVRHESARPRAVNDRTRSFSGLARSSRARTVNSGRRLAEHFVGFSPRLEDTTDKQTESVLILHTNLVLIITNTKKKELSNLVQSFGNDPGTENTRTLSVPSGDISASPMRPDDARRYPSDVYAYEQLTQRTSNQTSSVEPIASDGCLCHPIKGSSACPAATSANVDVPLGNVTNAANLKNIAGTRHPTSEVGLHHTPSSALGYPRSKSLKVKKGGSWESMALQVKFQV